MADEAQFAFHPPSLAEAYAKSNAEYAKLSPRQQWEQTERSLPPMSDKLKKMGE
jgi:hypothetical protein